VGSLVVYKDKCGLERAAEKTEGPPRLSADRDGVGLVR
jgi:hypothetical protein